MMEAGFRVMRGSGGPRRAAKPTFEDLEAMELYCPSCRRPVPVRKYLLLVLPEGDKYEYKCGLCGAVVGDKTVRGGQL